MLEGEMLDHIEKVNHRDVWTKLGVEEYRKWFSENIKVEERTVSPYDQPWLKNVRSLGIETRTRHE